MTETTEPTVAAVQPETKTPETATTPAAEGDSAPAPEATGKTNGEATPDTEAAAVTTEEAKEEEKEPVKEMRAVVLTGFGGFKGVKIQKKPEPTAQAGEVLIRVRAWWVESSVVRSWMMRLMRWRSSE